MKVLLISIVISLGVSVTLTADDIYVDATQSGSGSSWSDAHAYLQDALAAANSGDTIHVAAGTYYPDDGGGQTEKDRNATFQLKSGVALYGGYPTGGGARDHTHHPTILSGDIGSSDAYHVVTGSGTDSTAILDGFSIRDGDSYYQSDAYGAGLYNDSGSPTIINCSFSGNLVADYGGAVYNKSSSATFTNCTFTGNRTKGYGGAVYNVLSSPSFINCTFSNNMANWRGGAVYNSSSSPSFISCAFAQNTTDSRGGAIYNSNSFPTIHKCSFIGNSSEEQGGAIYTSTSDPVITDCVFMKNTAEGSGGAIYILSESTVDPIISACLFSENTSVYYGGAISCHTDYLTVVDCHFRSNTSERSGGAIEAWYTVDLNRCHFYANQAANNGGAIECTEEMIVRNSLFFGNVADQGGALSGSHPRSSAANSTFSGNKARTSGGAIYGALTLNNCIIWNNQANESISSASASIDNYDGAQPSSFAYCLVANSGGSLSWDSSIGIDGGNNIDMDPGFRQGLDPSTAPSTLGDFQVTSSSPVIDAGNNPVATSKDLSGFPRSIDGDRDGSSTVDLGAYELPAVVYVDQSATGGSNDGSSWGDAYTDLQTALLTASPGSHVWVAAGTYYPDQGTGQVNDSQDATFILRNAIHLYGGFPPGGGDGTFVARDMGSHATILSGDIDQDGTLANNAYHVVTGSGTDATSQINGFTVTAGNAVGASPHHTGGGLYNDAGAPVILNCRFMGNAAAQSGGGMSNISATPAIANCLFSGNVSGVGGALYSEGDSALYEMINCTFTGNSAAADGGAIYSHGGARPNFINCILWNNMANGSSSSLQASVANSGAAPTFSHCVVANTRGSSNWDIDTGIDAGGNIDTDPLFVEAVDPATAPTSDGDLSLPSHSPAIDVGQSIDNFIAIDMHTDLASKPRIEKTIDLGAYESVTPLQLVVEDPNQNVLTNGATMNLSYLVHNEANLSTLTLKNLAYVFDLEVADVNSNHAEAVITSDSSLVVPPQSSDSLGITITPNQLGAYHAVITISNNDPDDNPFVIHLTGMVVSNVDDDDGDSLTNYEELAIHGTNPNLVDTDQDGANDGNEVQLAAAGLSFSNGTDDSDKLALLRAHADSINGLYVAENIHNLSLSRPVLRHDRDTGKLHLKTIVKSRSDDTAPWAVVPGIFTSFDAGPKETILEFTPADDQVKFYRFYWSETP